MTPDAVIFRYLQLGSPRLADADAFCDLLMADADLLSAWLRTLHLPASHARLRESIAGIAPSEFGHLARAQTASLINQPGSARLALDQWRGVMRATWLASALYRFCAERDALAAGEELLADIRMRALLAISGVHLSHDARLAALNEYRGVNPVLLEDADLELRVFAVVDAFELGGEEAISADLLGLTAPELADVVAHADGLAEAAQLRLDVAVPDGVDWADRIHLYQQISVVAGALAGCGSVAELAKVHDTVSRAVFRKAPLLLLPDPSAHRLTCTAEPTLSLAVDSGTSQIAAALRAGAGRHIEDAADLAVVDRQLLKRLPARAAWVACATIGEQPFAVLVDDDEDLDVETAAQLYADALTQELDRLHALLPAEPPAEPAEDAFHDHLVTRLRELVHEANNPLSIVHNYLHILELRLQDQPEVVEQLTLIDEELRRAGAVFARVREVPDEPWQAPTSGDSRDPEGGELVAWLGNQVELHRGLAMPRGVLVRAALPEEPVTLHAQWDLLAQVLSNLLKNAIEACATDDIVDVELQTGIYRDGRPGVELSIRDTGPGLSDDVLASLRDAKTSGKSEGQGVGLQIVYELVERLHGALDYRPNQPRGARFALYLPMDGSA